MKKNIIILLCLIIILSLIFCLLAYSIKNKKPPKHTSSSQEFYKKNCHVIIDDIKYTDVYAEIVKGHLHISLIDFLNKLDFIIRWQNDCEIFILRGNKAYILNLEKKSLIEHDKNFNMLDPPPGCTYYYCTVVNKTLIIDEDTLRVVMKFLEKNLIIDIDNQNCIVSISSR